MSSGFKVDLTALVKAAEGVNATIADISIDKVSGIAGSQASYGDGNLAATCADFCSRWQIGVQNLTTDVNQVASRLALSAVAYANAEKKNIADLSGVLQRSTGTDPAASEW
jgi:SUMO ligase MMS21 Smc5/6 complex component